MWLDSAALDQLTGLPTRQALTALLEKYSISKEQKLSLFSVQISRFGHVNSSMGNSLADKIIETTAKRLSKIFPQAKMISRTHGDHFALLFDSMASVPLVIDRLQDFTQRPFAIMGEVVVLSVRIGVACQEQISALPAYLLQASEVALQHAKQSGHKTEFFTQKMQVDAKKLHKLENELRVALVNRHAELHRALHSDEFVLYYQPIVDASSKKIEGFEALIRWQHPDMGFISPVQFIPIAEQIQVMDVLGSWVIRRATADAKSWPLRQDGKHFSVSVNISPTQFANPDILVSSVEKALAETGLAPQQVRLEITESCAFNENMIACLEQLKALGCKIALDDFGTGFSSLTQLNQLPLDYLKLDRSFISDLDSEDASKAQRSLRMTSAILSLANTFGITPIVEGIETRQQKDLVVEHGVKLIQGFYYSKPIPSGLLNEFINEFTGEDL